MENKAQKYRDLLFDVDNTLLDFDRAEHEGFKETLKQHGCPTGEELIRAYSRINNDHWKMLERGEIDRTTLLWHRFWAFGQECHLEHLDPQVMAEDYMRNLSRQIFLLNGAEEVCRVLSGKYRLSAITNGNAFVQHSRFDHSPLFPYFYTCIISEEVGCAKPSEAFFRAVQQKLPDIRPDHTLVIGDSLTSDIAGGVRWGCDTCWLSQSDRLNPDRVEKDLRPTYVISQLSQLLDILKS